jgi:ATP-dependent DNA helicase RecG
MLTDDELRALLAVGETDRIERTASVNKADKFAEAVTAFANDLPGYKLPGYLVVGANDDGSLSGLSVTDELLLSLAALRSDGNIQPLPALTVKKFVFPEGELAVVEVLPSDQLRPGRKSVS